MAGTTPLGALYAWTKWILPWVPVAIAINDVGFSIADIKGNSMMPTLNGETQTRDSPASSLKRDRVLLDKWSIRLHRYNRGDVVVLRSPTNPQKSMVKRVIGVEGDWVQGRAKTLVRVPKGKCWVEGDNADSSIDSNNFGPVPLALIQGRVVGVIWPPSRVQSIESIVPPGKLFEM